MLKLRREQMDAMQKIHEKQQRIPVLCRYLKQKYHNTQISNWPAEKLTDRVTQAIHVARSYGLVSERDIYDFVTLEVVQYPGFHRHVKIQEALKKPNTDSNTRVLEMILKVPGPVWTEVG